MPTGGPNDFPNIFADIEYVFLDRDGVINLKSPEGKYIGHWDHFHFLPGVEEAIAALNRSGRTVIVVTNQRGVALGYYTKADVDAIHEALQKHLAQHAARIDAFYFCPHDKNECDCRKPLPGMFEEARREFPEISAADSLMVGDSLSDIEFGRRLGMKTVFIDGETKRQKPGAATAAEMADCRFPSLNEAVQALLDAR